MAVKATLTAAVLRVLSVGLREMIRFARYLALEPAYFA